MNISFEIPGEIEQELSSNKLTLTVRPERRSLSSFTARTGLRITSLPRRWG